MHKCRYWCNANLELVDKFCYLGDMLSVDRDAYAAVETRIRTEWNIFRQLVTLLTNKNISLTVRWRLYSSCVRCSMLHESETWPIRKENKVALKRADIRMVRWMCGVKLQDRVPSDRLRQRLGLDDIISVLRQKTFNFSQKLYRNLLTAISLCQHNHASSGSLE